LIKGKIKSAKEVCVTRGIHVSTFYDVSVRKATKPFIQFIHIIGG